MGFTPPPAADELPPAGTPGNVLTDNGSDWVSAAAPVNRTFAFFAG